MEREGGERRWRWREKVEVEREGGERRWRWREKVEVDDGFSL